MKVSDSNTPKSSVPKKETSSANGEINAHLQSDVDNDIELFEENDHQQLLSIFDHQQPTSPAVQQHISSVNQQRAASLANEQQPLSNSNQQLISTVDNQQISYTERPEREKKAPSKYIPED